MALGAEHWPDTNLLRMWQGSQEGSALAFLSLASRVSNSLPFANRGRRITESLQLEETLRIIEPNHNLTLALNRVPKNLTWNIIFLFPQPIQRGGLASYLHLRHMLPTIDFPITKRLYKAAICFFSCSSLTQVGVLPLVSEKRLHCCY